MGDFKDKMGDMMRSLVLDVPADLQIEINSHVFSVSKSDVDIINKFAEFEQQYAGLKSGGIAGIKEFINGVIAYIDEILGDGAVYRISGGKPIGAVRAYSWLQAICGEVIRACNDYISEKYE